MITIDFGQRGTRTLTECIYGSVKQQILGGSLRSNEKLPSKRALALHLGVSVLTVQNAYQQLIDEGLLYSIEKKGFFVSDIVRHLNSGTPSPAQFSSRPAAADRGGSPPFFADFTSNAVSPEKFPFSLWSRTMRQVLNANDERLLLRTDIRGSRELRRAICRHLREFRNMDVSEEQVIVGAGTESLYSMLVQFLGRDKVLAVENPGYHKAGEIFRLNGSTCIPVRIDSRGISVEELEQSGASIVHVSPSHHFPTGITMDFRRRLALLEWASGAPGRYIIEDDYDSEFRFAGKPLPTLQSIDREGHVMYINTFSKTLSPSFRISYMVLPAALAGAFSGKLGFYSCPVSSFEQFTLARFIDDGNYERHINKMKNFYRSLRNNLITAFCNSRLSECGTIHEENAGLHFLLTVKKGYDARELRRLWRAAGINIQLLSDFYYGGRDAEGEDSFVVNYSGIKRDAVGQIVRRMSSVLCP